MTIYLRNIAGLADSEDQPQIFIVCLAAYAKGILFGAWLDATQAVADIQEQIKQLLAKSPHRGTGKFAIQDYMGFGSWRIDESACIEDIQQKAVFILEQGLIAAELIAFYDGNLEQAKEASEKYYEGQYWDKLDYATCLFNKLHLPKIPEKLQNCIDYKQFQRNIFSGEYFCLDVKGSCHIFRHH